jgi:purine nucleoside permease
MRSGTLLATLVAGSSVLSGTFASPLSRDHELVKKRNATISPKVVIISMFDPEGEAWYGIPEFNVLAQNISVPGLSPRYPEVHCTADGVVCQVTIGEAGAWRTTTALSFNEGS